MTMSWGRARARVRTLGIACLVLAAFGPQTPADERAAREVEVGAPVTPFVYDGDLRDLPQEAAWRPGDPIREIPMRHFFPPGAEPLVLPGPEVDPLVALQREVAAAAARGTFSFGTPIRNFPGLGYTGVNPPDTVGDVGPDHFVQSINSGGGADVRIWNKAEPSPAILVSFRLDTLGTGLCASGLGDPIVLYDRQADRWLLTEFSSSGNNLCVYVSQTPDPVSGGWFAYGFTMPSFPDYPKYAVWATDANGGAGSYVVTANDGGPGVIALDRGKMLTGQPASFQRRAMPGLPGFGIQGPAPADPDGPNGPPAGAPAIVMRHRDTEVHGGPAAPGDLLEMWHFNVDWLTPANTTLTQAPSIHVSEFDSTVCGLAFAGCFPQPNSATSLMPIREVIMNRIQYYHHGDFESLVGNFVVDVGGDHGGVRWFELRRTEGGSWGLRQEGTYSIDAAHRWMGSIAMDQSENLALAYNVVSSSVFPSLRYTGRQFDDPPGVMTEPEALIHAGTASNGSYRYGDYAAMGLDPSDDCTFWFTGMNNTSSSWRTQSASFRFDRCGCLDEPAALGVDAAPGGDNEIDLFWADADLETVTEYRLQRSRTPGGPYETIAVVADTSPGVAGGPGYAWLDVDVSGETTYYYVVEASDGARCRSPLAAESSATATGRCTLRPSFAGLASATSASTETCSVALSWAAAVPECGGPAVYNVHRSTVPGFSPGPGNLLVAGVVGTSAVDINSIADESTYRYVVRAVDLGNGVEDANAVEKSVLAAGPGSGLQTIFAEDFETPASFASWTVSNGPGPHSCGEWARSLSATQRPIGGAGTYALALSQSCTQLLPRTSTKIDSPPIDLTFDGIRSVKLEVDLFYQVFDGDNATIEVWNGSSWVVVWTDPNATVNQRLSIDVSTWAIGNPAFRVRFNYQNAQNDRWYAIDDVAVVADVSTPCSAATAAPAPAGGDGLRADRGDPSGGTLAVTWDASCGAPDYELLWGDLAGVSAYEVGGAVCGLGTGGTATWSGVPAGSLWFLVAGTDGAGTESSWGAASFGERNGLTASGTCGSTFKSLQGVCP